MSNGNNTSAHIAARKLKASDIEKEYAQGFGHLENFYLNDPRSIKERCKVFLEKIKPNPKYKSQRKPGETRGRPMKSIKQKLSDKNSSLQE